MNVSWISREANMAVVAAIILLGWGFVIGAKVQEKVNPPAEKKSVSYGAKYDGRPAWVRGLR